MTGIRADIRYGIRLLRKSPLLTAAAVLSLALGISANSVIFSVLNALVLQPLPYPEPDRLVVAWQNRTENPEDIDDVSPANFVDWTRRSRSFERLAAFTGATFNLTEDGTPEEVTGMQVTPGFFETLKIPAARGRLFSEQDAITQSRVAIISHGLWQRRFGSDAGVLGRRIRLNGIPHTIVGVMRPSWFLVPDANVWTPLGWSPSELRRDDHLLSVIGRLKSGVSLEQARSEMDSIARQLADTYPKENTGYGVLLKAVGDVFPGERDRRVLLILMGAVGAVLLIACANVANLQLARSNLLAREFAVRTALGAQRWRIIRQQLTASIILALTGGLAGLALSSAAIQALTASVVLSGSWNPIALDPPVIVFTFAVSVLSGIAFGILPAIRKAPDDALRQNDRTLTRGGAIRQFGRVLVGVEIMLALALLAIGADMTRGFIALRHLAPGFDSRNLATARLSLPAAQHQRNQFTGSQSVTSTFDRIADSIRRIPGVQDVAYTTVLPRSQSDPKARFVLPQNRTALGGEAPIASWRAISTNYFDVMKIPVLEGRTFTVDDRFGKEPVAVISAAMAARFFPGTSAIGKQIYFFDAPRRVIGVAADTLLNRSSDLRPCIYLPHAQSPRLGMHMLVRVAGSPSSVLAHLGPAVWEVDRDQAVSAVMTFESYADLQFAGRRLITSLLITFCVVALIMAAIGVYGVISYEVTQRTKDIGIRMALGASRGRIFAEVMRESSLVAAAGVASGSIALVVARRALADFWGGILDGSWTVPAAMAALVFVVAILATVIPAKRATSVAPNTALREY